MTALTVSAPPKLPVRQTVGACYATVAGNLGQLVRISWLWLLIMVPVCAALFWLEWRHAVPTTVVQIVELPSLASIAVAWHRLILRQERVAALAYLRLDDVVVRYVLKGIVIGLLSMALWLLMGLVVAWVGFADLAQRAVSVVMQAADLEDDPEEIALSELLVLSLAVLLLVVPRLSLVLPPWPWARSSHCCRPGAGRGATRCAWRWPRCSAPCLDICPRSPWLAGK